MNGLSTTLISTVVLLLTFGSNQAQVYVDPNAPAPVVVQPSAIEPSNDNLITQTVYGFLDFTTTIGNTVMVFSPQSAAVATDPPKTTQKPTEPPVIVTNPPTTTTQAPVGPPIEIKPSKPVQPKKESVEKKPAVVLSSVVQVVEEKAPIIKPKSNKKPIVSKIEVLPEKKPTLSVKKDVITKVEVREEAPVTKEPVIVVSRVEAVTAPVQTVTSVESVVPVHEEPQPVIYSSIVEVQSSSNDDDEPVLVVENNIGEPEYDFLSRQVEYAEESYRVANIKPSQRRAKPTEPRKTQAGGNHPLGLVTKLGGTEIHDGVTTVHETSVIGTSISGKYAQILQSTSHVFVSSPREKIKPTPSQTLRILKTAAPKPVAAQQRYDESPTAEEIDTLYGNSPTPNLVRSSRKPASSTGSFKNRINNNKNQVKEEVEVVQPSSPNTPAYGTKKTTRRSGLNKNKSSFKNGRTPTPPPSSVQVATYSVETATSTRRFKASRAGGAAVKPTSTYSQANGNGNNGGDGYSRRAYQKNKPQPTPVEPLDAQSTSLYKFKLNRQPGRWQYKTTAKPRVTIRKQNEIARDDTNNVTPVYEQRSDDGDLEQSGSLINGDVLNEDETGDNRIDRKFPIETIKVEISTPADFKDTYYEIATIKSPYTFQVGTVKNTRYITVTSTFEKTLDPEPTIAPTLTEPLTENILAKTTHIDKEHNLLDSSIATLPAITLASDTETPPLETLTETFSTTQLMLKTHILPVIKDANTTSYTLIQTYHITRLVTATKTLPPMDAYHFVPSKRLNEFNSRLDEAGSELHLELEYGDNDDDDDDDTQAVRKEFPPDLDLSNVGSDFDLSEVDKTNIPENARPKKKQQTPRPTTEAPLAQVTPQLSPEQLQQLALLRLLNPGAQLPGVLSPSSKPVYKIETVYDTHVLPIVNGASTFFSTLSRPIGTVTKTEYEMVTPTVPALPIPPLPQVNPLFQQPQQQFQLASTPIVTQTHLTQTQSKVLKLTFGAKTAYTTLFSTTVIPTMLTTYLTQSIPVQPTAAFPGYFPAPYGPYPYVG